MERVRYLCFAALAVLVGLQASCSPRTDEGRLMNISRLEFLTRSTCKNSDAVLGELSAALDQLGLEMAPVIVDLGELEKDDYRTGYGTPTILVNGHDLFGLAKPGPASPI